MPDLTNRISERIQVDMDMLSMDIKSTNETLSEFIKDWNTISKDRFDQQIDTEISTTSTIVDMLNILNETISTLQIVLDSGTLVGELTPKIDQSLGNNSVLVGRGVL